LHAVCYQKGAELLEFIGVIRVLDTLYRIQLELDLAESDNARWIIRVARDPK